MVELWETWLSNNFLRDLKKDEEGTAEVAERIRRERRDEWVLTASR
jgi:hypothetical protein